jgi:hypothetical protein
MGAALHDAIEGVQYKRGKTMASLSRNVLVPSVTVLLSALLGASGGHAGTLAPSYTDFEEAGFVAGASINDTDPVGNNVNITNINNCVQAWRVGNAGPTTEDEDTWLMTCLPLLRPPAASTSCGVASAGAGRMCAVAERRPAALRARSRSCGIRRARYAGACLLTRTPSAQT